VRLIYERLGRDDLGWLDDTARRAESGERIAILRTIVGDELTRRIAGEREGASAVGVIKDHGAFVELLADARPRVFVYGAGHVGAAVVGLLEAMPAVVTWIDRRGEFPGVAERRARMLSSIDEAKLAGAAPAGACHLVLTHDHQLDYEIVRALLKCGDFAYCGLIGSLTKRGRFERRLVREGLGEATLKRLTCPIGAEGLASRTPEAIALSAVHELYLAHEAHERGR
jgi:xanthine/CO dehydrogenase XdhC/CoxF family maturation factor